ncbi:hypothetical protein I6A60_15230 [Frankia sp. AgB1.9]|uniref:hypothetical protein n=1 Tax=unclassified Frankia TaxID=2632575 RepID=UPI00193338F3|nr:MULTISPECIES: hypothetical protein [unclassified Frankia]MBL7549228.1 hypothetical protein [Frankia sp. AgB1.9]MBL7619445.1 hypothetical protein [Frankia sp. AgB1.8]
MTKEKARPESDDFGGMSRGGAAFLVAVVALGHPWQALRELFTALRRLARRTSRLAMAPAALVAAVLWSRQRDRRPTFEDYLHGGREESGPPG